MNRPWMPFYFADFQMDTLELRADELGIYIVLLGLAWRREGALPSDLDVLETMVKRCISGFHGHTFNRIVPKLLHRYFYQDEAGDWRQKRMEKELQTARKCSANASQNAGKRWEKKDQNELFQRVTNSARNAPAMHARAYHNHNHKEESFNQLRQKRGNGSATTTEKDPNMPTKFTDAELERHEETHRVYVKQHTKAGEAWAEWTRQKTGIGQLWDKAGGWWFPSEWPPEAPTNPLPS
jgi:uncharacterized protein YdaU (DUF1376 family)